jgi:hypothetical protein
LGSTFPRAFPGGILEPGKGAHGMASFKVDPNGKRRPKRIKRTVPKERVLEHLLMCNPELLPHPDGVAWFDKSPAGPGDLVGLDRKGLLVVVEVKRRLGTGEAKKSRVQVRRRARQVKAIEISDIERKYTKLRERMRQEKKLPPTFAEAFEKQFDRKLTKTRLATDKPARRYVVFDYPTKGGRKGAQAGNKRVKKQITHVSIQVLGHAEDGKRLVVSVEKLN